MTMTMDELMKVLDMQEDILQFTHFTNADAWELGTMILMEARRRGAQVGIMIRRSNGEVVFRFHRSPVRWNRIYLRYLHLLPLLSHYP